MNGLPFSIFWIIFHMNTSWFTYVFYCRGIFELTFHYYECMWCPVNIHVLVCVCVCVLSSTLCDPMDCSPPGSSVDGIFQEKYWNGLPFPPPGDLPDPGIAPTSPVSPALQVDSLPSETSEKHFWWKHDYIVLFFPVIYAQISNQTSHCFWLYIQYNKVILFCILTLSSIALATIFSF